MSDKYNSFVCFTPEIQTCCCKSACVAIAFSLVHQSYIYYPVYSFFESFKFMRSNSWVIQVFKSKLLTM